MTRNRLLYLAVLLTCAMVLRPYPALARDREVGIGFNFAFGPIIGEVADSRGVIKDGIHAGIELANFELRLFPTDGFSFDLQWNWLTMATVAATVDESFIYAQSTSFHIHTKPGDLVSFAVAPTVQTQFGQYLGSPYVDIGVGSRVGVDLSGPGRKFGFGIYLRPSFHFGTVDRVDVTAFGGLLEMTWIWYGFKKSS